jgi:hypothetical protein
MGVSQGQQQQQPASGEGGSYDLVICSLVLCTLSDRQEYLKVLDDLASALKPGRWGRDQLNGWGLGGNDLCWCALTPAEYTCTKIMILLS